MQVHIIEQDARGIIYACSDTGELHYSAVKHRSNGRAYVTLTYDGGRHSHNLARVIYASAARVSLESMRGCDVHHVNGDRHADMFTNLALLPHREHMRLHGIFI